MENKIQQIHHAAMELLSTVGMKFHHPVAIKILKEHGITVKGDVAYFKEEQIMTWVKKAPSQFTLYAPNPDHNVVIGGKDIQLAPPYGSPAVTEANDVKRPGTIRDYVNFTKLFQVNEDYHINGGLIVQPCNVSVTYADLAMVYAAFTHSDKAMLIPTGKREHLEAMLDCAALFCGGRDTLKQEPRLCTIVNTNTPLQLDCAMAEVLLTLAENGQPFAVTNGAMAGSTAPVTLAGTLTMANAEVLACIALAEMVNPGTPVLYASQATAADMRTVQMACGAPEGGICAKYVAMLSRFYNLPCRGCGALTDAKAVDAQAGLESMLSLMAGFENHIDLILHGAGILDSYLSVSYEKAILDFEILRYVKRYFRDIEVSEETIPLALMIENGHGGEYLTKEHTLLHCRKEPLLPHICSRGNHSNQLSDSIQQEYEKMMDGYKKPDHDENIFREIKTILCNQGLKPQLAEEIEMM